jgi:hypothetical protein
MTRNVMALKFGRLYKTPAMQAGLASKPLTCRQIFMSGSLFVVILISGCFGLGAGVKSRAA